MNATEQRLLSDNTFALRTHEAAMRDLRPWLVAALPQVFTERQLAERWALDVPQVLAVLMRDAGLPAGSRTARVPVEVVIQLDELIKRHASVRADAVRLSA